VLIQFDASSSEDPSKISSEGVPSSVAHTDHTEAWGAFLTVKIGLSWVVGTLSNILAIPNYAPFALSENANRKSEITFRDDPFVFFSDALDAVARNAGISLRNRNEMTNFIGARG
jgi:hypothetical protein